MLSTSAWSIDGPPGVCGSWTEETLPAPVDYPFVSVWDIAMLETGEAWLIGIARETTSQSSQRRPYAASWSGSSWQEETLPTIDDLVLVELELAVGRVWAVGTSGISGNEIPLVINRRLAGTGWNQLLVHDAQVRGVRANNLKVFSPIDYWFAGGAQSMHWDGSDVDIFPMNGGSVTDFDGVTTDDLWAVGTYGNTTDGYIRHWDGQTWESVPKPQPFGDSNQLSSVFARGTDDIWILGAHFYNNAADADGVIHRWDGVDVDLQYISGGPNELESFGADTIITWGYLGGAYWSDADGTWSQWFGALPSEPGLELGSLATASGCRAWQAISRADMSDGVLRLRPSELFANGFEDGTPLEWSATVP